MGDSFFNDLILNYVYMCASVYVCMCSRRAEEVMGSPGAGITGGCEPARVCPANLM